MRDVVERQHRSGLDIVSDGEQSKAGFFAYMGDRLSGFEPTSGSGMDVYRPELDAFPEYYQQYLESAMLGGMVAPSTPLACTSPVSYVGQDQLRRDLEHLKAAVGETSGPAFVSAVSPSGVGRNEHYSSEAEYLNAVADALNVEYRAIVDAGFDVQIDDPFLSDIFSYMDLSDADKHAKAMVYVDAINRGLRGIPADRVRFHTCYGINEGPRTHDAPLPKAPAAPASDCGDRSTWRRTHLPEQCRVCEMDGGVSDEYDGAAFG